MTILTMHINRGETIMEKRGTLNDLIVCYFIHTIYTVTKLQKKTYQDRTYITRTQIK